MDILLHLLVLILITSFCFYHHYNRWLTCGALILAEAIMIAMEDWHVLSILYVTIAVCAALVTPLRTMLLSAPTFQYFKRVLPPMTRTEREALEAGTTWWDAELFQGKPHWQKFLDVDAHQLTTEEQAFLDNQTNTLCKMIDDWKVMNEDKDLPKAVWDYIKQEGFLGMIIPKAYGGLGFSALAQSKIISRITSRSVSAAVTVMVPNSLGPAELLLEYGTDEQKQQYLSKLASGEHVPCFALTAPNAGSDASSLTDTGVICKSEWNGEETIGIRLNFEKRYITLAPIATVMGLAFKLYDPDHLIGERDDYGITVCLLPTDTPGVDNSNRHLPMGAGFMNGPIFGKDVFIPLDWIIGGKDYAGKGWQMLMECLSAGRGISLPALASSGGHLSYMTTGAYARVRKQFKMPIGYFEGVEEALAEIGGFSYIMESSRHTTLTALDQGEKPSVVTAMMKYHMTELGRKVNQCAMDIHGGRALILGPRNYLAHGYITNPVSITVEGANILTRNLIIFGQGAMRCHPYLYDEIQAAQLEDEQEGLKRFDKLLTKHIAYVASNKQRAFWMGLTNAAFAKSPVKDETRYYFRQLDRMSAALGYISDVTMLMLGGELKRKERLSARLGDVLSHLYMGSSCLKYYHNNGAQQDDLPFVQWSLDYCLHEIQRAFYDFFNNFPNKALGKTLRWVVFPWGRRYHQPTDKLGHRVARHMLSQNELRERLTSDCYVGDAGDPVHRMEDAFQKVLKAEQADKTLRHAIKDGKVTWQEDELALIEEALSSGAISSDEATLLRDAYEASLDAIHVDHFPSDTIGAQRSKPHLVQDVA